MKHAKICTNELCTEKKKKHKKESEVYCIYCGKPFTHVCSKSKCEVPIAPDSEESLCPVHLEEARKRAERSFELAKKAALAVATVGVCAHYISHGLGLKKKKEKKKKK